MSIHPTQDVFTRASHPIAGNRRRSVIVFCSIILVILGLLVSACGPKGPSDAELTATAVAAYTPTPAATPTPAGITPDQDLAALIDTAADGDVITLAPGVFRLAQGISISKNLTLIGAGGDQTILTAAAPATDIPALLAFTGSGSLALKGIKLEYVGSAPSSILYANSGSLTLEDCTVTGATMTAENVPYGAVYLANTVAANFINTRVFGSPEKADPKNPTKIPGGVFVGNEAQLTFTGGVVADSYTGIYASGQGQVTITESTFSNSFASVTVKTNALGILRQSKLSACSAACVVVLDDAHFEMTDTSITSSPEGIGVQADGNALITLERNAITNLKSGIVLGSNSSGTINDNTLDSNFAISIMVQGTSAPMITNNLITLGSGDMFSALGIVYQDSAGGEARGNEITDLFVGVSLSNSAAPLLESNEIRACQIGISYADQSSGTANGNTISAEDAGILISSPAAPTITNNTIYAFQYPLSSDPPDWINTLNVSGNTTQEGPPEANVIIVTITPTAQ